MPPKSEKPVDAREDRAAPTPVVARVMLISGAPSMRAQLRAWIDDLRIECETEWLNSLYEATVRLVRTPADVLVLDHDVDPANLPEFVRHVARVAPGTRVFVCAESHRTALSRAFDILSWGECEIALKRWSHRWQRTPSI